MSTQPPQGAYRLGRLLIILGSALGIILFLGLFGALIYQKFIFPKITFSPLMSPIQKLRLYFHMMGWVPLAFLSVCITTYSYTLWRGIALNRDRQISYLFLIFAVIQITMSPQVPGVLVLIGALIVLKNQPPVSEKLIIPS